MIVNLLLGITGVILFLFVFWKRLKEDYSSTIIFQVASGILAGLTLGLVLSRLIAPSWFFWISFFGALLGTAVMIYRFKLRFYETLEALILASMPIVSMMFFKDSIINSSLTSFLAFVAILVLIFLSYWFDISYKNLTWYKSGKIGFAGLSTAILLFFTRFIVAIGGLTMISFVDKIDPVFSGIFTVISIVLLINLGRKEK